MTTDPRHCLWCEDILDLECEHDDQDYDEEYCSLRCYLHGRGMVHDRDSWLFWLPINEIPLARCLPILSYTDLFSYVVVQVVHRGRVVVADDKHVTTMDPDYFYIDMTEPAGFAHVLRWVADRGRGLGVNTPGVFAWTIAARDGTVTDDDRLELAMMAYKLSHAEALGAMAAKC